MDDGSVGWAGEAAERIRKMHEDVDRARSGAQQTSDIIARDYRELWETLGECIRREVRSFSELLPCARHVACSSADENSLTVSTQVQPLIILRIILVPERYVLGDRTEIPSPFSAGVRVKGPKFRFAVDGESRICFTEDECNPLHATQVASRLLDPVGRFFEPRGVRSR